jgi:hypothetical protein
MDDIEESNSRKPKRIPFWRLGFGLVLLLAAAGGYLAPKRELNLPANPAGKQGENAGRVIILLGGAWLVLTFIYKTTKKPDQ